MQRVTKGIDGVGKNIDYVVGWYFQTAKYIQGTNICSAFVSTNSITQGEQVIGVWKPLFDQFQIHIDFAYRTFSWSSEAKNKANVYCVIVGFSVTETNKRKVIYDGNKIAYAQNINGYLIDADNVFVEKRRKPLCNVPEMFRGSEPTDDGNLILTEEEKDKLIHDEPFARKFIRPFMSGNDFITRKPRYCLWLVNASPNDLKECPQILKRVEAVKTFRISSKRAKTLSAAKTPTLFEDNKVCETKYVAIPKVSTSSRRYIPIDYLNPEIIANDLLFQLPSDSAYYFGVLDSNVHMAWMRAVCGRLGTGYRYSSSIVYNTFPWPNPTPEQKVRIEQTAQGILDARALYPDSSLADLYDELTMPPELRKAHQDNDRAVMQAYGFSVKDMTESMCVAELMKMYQKLVDGK